MKYGYSDDTLIHSVGYNLQRFESVLKEGIYSANLARKLGVSSYVKNYKVVNQDDNYISCVRVGSINEEIFDTSYNKHTKEGLGFIIEDVKPDILKAHNPDEVLVKDYISPESIKGICIPARCKNLPLDNIAVIPFNIKRTTLIERIAYNYANFLRSKGLTDGEYVVILLEINTEMYTLRNTIDEYKASGKHDTDEEYFILANTIKNINEYLAYFTKIVFNRIDENIKSISDAALYLANNSLKIYDIPKDNSLYRGKIPDVSEYLRYKK